MEELKKISGKLVIKPEKDVVFECCVFENVEIDACYGNVKFLNCTFLNDFCLKNANDVSFYLSTFLFDGGNKMMSSVVIGNNICMEYVYINDLNGSSVCKFVSDVFKTENLVFDSVNERKSYFDVISNSYMISNSDINVMKNFMMKDNMEEISSKVKMVTKRKRI